MRRYNRVKVTVEDGTTFMADVVIVAVPLGVLKAKSIKFEPRFPDWKEATMDDLGAGIESKIALYFDKLRKILPVASALIQHLVLDGVQTSIRSFPIAMMQKASPMTWQMATEDCRMRVLGRYGELDLSQLVMGKEASLSVSLLISTHITALASFTKIP
ncbi:hypothetical protein REPUB_Repub10bG0104100 [Reevesia pubescens]